MYVKAVRWGALLSLVLHSVAWACEGFVSARAVRASVFGEAEGLRPTLWLLLPVALVAVLSLCLHVYRDLRVEETGSRLAFRQRK